MLDSNETNKISGLYGGNYDYITDEMTYEITTASTCDIAVVKEKYMSLQYGVGMQKNSIYKAMISLL